MKVISRTFQEFLDEYVPESLHSIEWETLTHWIKEEYIIIPKSWERPYPAHLFLQFEDGIYRLLVREEEGCVQVLLRGGDVDQRPIKLHQGMVEELVALRNQLAETEAKCRKIVSLYRVINP